MSKSREVAAPPIPRAVLVIDDHAERLRAVRTALAGAGYTVEMAGEAQAADAKLHARRPDFILTDLQLPGRDGWPLARNLLADPQWEGVPVLAFSADRADCDQRQKLEDLFDGYCPEPLDAAELIRQLQALRSTEAPPAGKTAAAPAEAVPSGDPRIKAEEVLESLETGLPQSQFAPATAASLQRLAAALASPESGGLPGYLARAAQLCSAATVRGAAGFRSVVRLGREVLSRDPDPAPAFESLRTEYLENRVHELAVLAAALRRADFAALKTAAHNLKGTGAAYGFAELTELGRALEAAAQEGDALRAEVLLSKTEFYLGLVSRQP